MLKNTASQTICFQGISATDGTAVTTGTPTVYVLGDGGTLATGSGTKTHEGQGVYSYVPTQAETNYDHVSYTMVLSGAINHTINVYPSTFDYTAATETSIANAAADAVWDESQAAHATAGSFGEIATEIADILVDTGTTLPATLTTIDNEIATIDSNVDLVLGDTNELQTDWVNGGRLDLLLDTAAAGGGLDAAGVRSAIGLASANLDTQLSTIDGNVDDILEDTSTTIPASLTTIDNEIATIDSNVDLVLEDTGTTLPATLATIDGNVDDILEDTGTTIPATLTTIDNEIAVIDGNVDLVLEDTGTTLPTTLATIDGNVDDILEDTGTTIPATLTTIDNEIAAMDSNVDAILVDTGTTLPATLATIDSNVDDILVDTNSTIPATLTTIDNEIAAIDGNVDDILADTNELQTDWVNGGRLDLLLDTAAASSGGGSVDANITSILGTALTEATSGRIAGNFDTFFENSNSATTKVVDDIGSATVSGSIDANVTQIKGSNVTETTAGRLAANFSTLFDNGDAASTKVQNDIGTATFGSTVDANVVQYLGTAITETTSGRLAQNWSTLHDNNDQASSKLLSDIGTAVVTGQLNANLTEVLGTPLTETTASNLADNISQFYDLDTTTTKTVDDVDQATVTGTVDANLTSILSTSITESSSGRIAGNWDNLFDNGDVSSAVTLQTLQTIADDVDGVAGSGARTITVNVKDTESTPANLENAKVRLTEGVNTFVASTNSSGNAVFALDDATYNYSITKAGYASETGTLTVTADATVNKDIAQSTITPSTGSDTSTGVLVVRDENYALEQGVDISIQLTAGPGTAGEALDTAVRTVSSDSSGEVQFANMIRGATYNVWRSDATSTAVFGTVATAGSKISIVVPDSASFNLPELLGTE